MIKAESPKAFHWLAFAIGSFTPLAVLSFQLINHDPFALGAVMLVTFLTAPLAILLLSFCAFGPTGPKITLVATILLSLNLLALGTTIYSLKLGSDFVQSHPQTRD